MKKPGNQYPPPPNTWKWGGGGGSGYLYLHYWPPVDRKPAIYVDMVNSFQTQRQTNYLNKQEYFWRRYF